MTVGICINGICFPSPPYQPSLGTVIVLALVTVAALAILLYSHYWMEVAAWKQGKHE